MKEQKDTPDCHLFETEWNTFVYDVGSNGLLTDQQELGAVLLHGGDHVRNLHRK
jgi:hypothetical protein